VPAATGVPHDPQNRASGSNGLPQCAHIASCGAPQCTQNLVPAGSSVPQLVHAMAARYIARSVCGVTEIQQLAAAHSARGELVLRRRGEVLELISNGTFLMDTSSGASERALADLALHGVPDGARVLVGGLGFGFTLAAVLAFEVADVVVVEIEPDVVAWNREWWPPSRTALDDRRVRVVIDDLVRFLESATATFDAVVLDIDNGPDWTVTDANDRLYSDAGLRRMRQLITAPGGRLCVWSANSSAEFAARLRDQFTTVAIHDIPVARGNPDVIFVATR
jgi:predicted membrane-bound spermidine synthase